MDSRVKELLTQGDGLFSKKMPLNSLHQEIADNFYPERADFTLTRFLGAEFAANLTTSYPVLVRRELHSIISGMLRPTEMDWFETSIFRDDRLDKAGTEWLQQATLTQKRAMYDRVTNLVRATKECDGDYVTFGNGVIHLQHNRRANALLYHCRHLRDCAWMENFEGKVDVMHRKWNTAIREVLQLMKGNNDAQNTKKLEAKQDKHATQEFRHIVIPAEDYDTGTGDGPRKKWSTKYVSILIDVENQAVLLEEPSLTFQYIVPRWQTVSGNQYGFSPCTVAGLPDARLIQQMMLTFLEAGQKAVNPPLLATQDVIKSAINLYEGGITWVDRDYDEKTGEALRVLAHDYSGIPVGEKIQDFIRSQLQEAFYLNKISGPLPLDKKDMTAFEVGQHVQNYVRSAQPLFEPIEMDYNGALCDMSFDMLLAHGTFGSVHDMPQSLRGQDIQFKFRSTLHDTVDKQRGPTFEQAKAMIADAMALDPAAGKVVKMIPSIKWALQGLGYPEKLMNSDEDIAKIMAKAAQDQQAADTITKMHAGAQTAQQIGMAAQSFKDAGITPGVVGA